MASNDFQEEATFTLLSLLSEHGFVLAGGQALRCHGITNRLSEDSDLFAPFGSEVNVKQALATVLPALYEDGYEIEVDIATDTYARLTLSCNGMSAKFDLGLDAITGEGIELGIGPVLPLDEAVGCKVAALFSRGAIRDYLDVAYIVRSRVFDTATTLRLASDVDAGFNTRAFTERLVGASEIDAEDVVTYGVEAGEWASLQETLTSWANVVAAMNVRDCSDTSCGAITSRPRRP